MTVRLEVWALGATLTLVPTGAGCDGPVRGEATAASSTASEPRPRPATILGSGHGNSRNTRLWERLRVDWRFPGVETYVKRTQGAESWCERVFDLAVDDVYVGPDGSPQRVIVDATFLKRGKPRPGAWDCAEQRETTAAFVHPIDREFFYFAEGCGAPFEGDTPDDPGRHPLPIHAALAGEGHRTPHFSLGASNAWLFKAPPSRLYAPMHLRFAFGPPGAEAKDLLAVATNGSVITVMRASPPAEGPADEDVSAEWEARHADDDLYFLRKTARAYLPETEIPKTKDALVSVLCPLLAESLAGPEPWPPDDAVFQRSCP